MSSSYQYWVTGLPLDKIDEMFIDQPLNIEQIGTPEGEMVLISRPNYGDASGYYRLYFRQKDVWSYVTIKILW